MKVAILSESPADEAAIRILADAVLGIKTSPVSHVGLLERGWPSVRSVFPTVLKQLHYHGDAEGLIFVVDSNGAVVHQPGHELPGKFEPRCRLCELRRIRDEVVSQLRLVAGKAKLKTAIGLAVPAIEAWLLCGTDAHVNEAAWITGQSNNAFPYTKLDLKKQLYGTERPSLGSETQHMTQAAELLAANRSPLEKAFPSGFGAFARDLKLWQQPD